jgi:transcriptional regulator GlxA family with amidase domain
LASNSAGNHVIAVLVLEGALPLDVGIPAQIFQPREGLPYELRMCGVTAGRVDSNEGLAFYVDHGLEALSDADTIIVPGYRPKTRPNPDSVLDALRAARDRGARIVSICTGAFALAEAGLLDGLRVTTHWRRADELASMFPHLDVDPNVLFIDEGQILTSAGVAAGIDLCLHIIRRDHGVQLSNRVARSIVAAPYRSGGQSQFVPRSIPDPLGDIFASTRHWALTRLQDPLTVGALAHHARVSSRTFARRFVEDTGYTPLQWILRARVDLARELLERSDLGVDQIADRVGLGTGANLRMHFQRILGTSPSDYRKAFASSAA